MNYKIKICPKCGFKLMLKRIEPKKNQFADAYICNNPNCEGGTFN